jgi:hypothetical protein
MLKFKIIYNYIFNFLKKKKYFYFKKKVKKNNRRI